MDGAGAPLKKAAVSGFGVGRQAQGRQAAFGRNIAFAERLSLIHIFAGHDIQAG